MTFFDKIKSLFGKIKSLFGKGVLQYDITFENGKSGTIKVEYIGSPETIDEESNADGEMETE